MPIPVSDLDARLSDILNDAGRVRWPLAERLRWINDGASEIVIRRPAANAVTVAATWVAGIRQTLPADAISLLDIPHNLAADGTTPTRIVRRTDRQLLDDINALWPSAKPQSAARAFTYDERDPKVYYLDPPVKAGTKGRVVYSAQPADATDINASLPLNAEYLGPLVSYVLYRALAKDSEYANGVLAAAHFQAFTEAVGTQNQMAKAASPNQEPA